MAEAFNVAAEWETVGEAFMKNPTQIPCRYVKKELEQFFVNASDNTTFPHFNLLEGKTERQLKNISSTHCKFRNLVRGESTAKLG